MMGSASVPRCQGRTCWQPVVAANITAKANAGMDFDFMAKLFAEQRFDLLAVFLHRFFAVKTGVDETDLAGAVHQK